jgi:hypothetical protein
MFKDKFYFLIEKDIMNMGIEPNSNPHHRVTIRGIDRKNPCQIPDIHKITGDKTERKILMIRDHGGTSPCNSNDVNYITSKYNINNLDKPRQLGKTGVTILKTPHGNYILQR